MLCEISQEIQFLRREVEAVAVVTVRGKINHQRTNTNLSGKVRTGGKSAQGSGCDEAQC
jgi:hypothetical protein